MCVAFIYRILYTIAHENARTDFTGYRGHPRHGQGDALRHEEGRVRENLLQPPDEVRGRNVVRYVPPGKVRPLRQAIAGYRKFLKLADEYAESVAKRTEI